MGPKPKLTQEEFDEAVKTNIEDFDMPREDAVKSAVEEFELQGYDLSGVITTGESIQTQPVAVATQALQHATDSASLASALEALRTALTAQSAQEFQTIIAVALQSGTVPLLLSKVRESLGSHSDTDNMVTCLNLVKELMPSADHRAALTNADGPELMQKLLAEYKGNSNVVSAVCSATEGACFQEEENKRRFVDAGFATTVLDVLRDDALSDSAVTSCCGALRAFTTGDDDRELTSKAFQIGCSLSKDTDALLVLHAVLRRVCGKAPAACAAALACIRQVAANDEACKKFCDDGGVMTSVNVIRSCLSEREVVRLGLTSLKQLANSDGIKILLAENGGIEMAMSVCHAYAEDAGVLEQALGLLSNMMLRQPEICTAVSDAGAMELVVEVMDAHVGAAALQRQACMMVRNMVVRNPELRSVFLEKGVEPLLRQAKKTHPPQCKDVGSAALRDLGLDNYND